MNVNRPVIIYGAGYRGGRNFIACAEENIHVEAFCDRDADNIPRYYGCDVLTCEDAVKQYPSLPYIISIDNINARRLVFEHLKELKVEVYESFETFFQGSKDVEIETVFCGAGAGFQIVPSLLSGKENLIAYCFGVGFDFSYEMELAQKYNMDVYAFDPNPEVIKNMKTQILPNNLTYYPYGISDVDDLKEFFIPSGRQDFSEYFAWWTTSNKIRLQVYRLSTILEKFGHSHLDILKMDVEGSEFMALPDILNSGVSFDQLCIETHTRIFSDSVDKMRGVKRLLNQYGYLLVSNEREEQTYIKRDMLDKCIL